MQSMTASILFNTPPPRFDGVIRRHHIDKTPAHIDTPQQVSSHNRRKRNVERVYAACEAGCETVSEVVEYVDLSLQTIRTALKDLVIDRRVVSHTPRDGGAVYYSVIES